MKRESPLFRKYLRMLVICMGGLACVVGIIHMLLVAEAQRKAVAELLNAETRTASGQIQNFLDNTVGSLKWIDDIDEPGTDPDYDAIRDAGYRFLRRAPSVIGLSFFDSRGCERLSISRLLPDTRATCISVPTEGTKPAIFAAARARGVAFSSVFFPDGSEPHLFLGIASRGRDTGALVAEINLKVIHDSVAAIRVGHSGIGFVVDANGRLLAHPDQSLVLRQSQVPATFAVKDSGGLYFATDFEGQRVATASRGIEVPTWRVIVEQPIREALAPVYAALWTTGALVLAAILSSLFAGLVVAGRLARPLSQLRDGAARIEKGDLSTQLSIATGDEIEEVADGFNRMARALADSRAHLEAKVEDRTAALVATTQKVQQQAGKLAELNAALEKSLEDARRRKDDAERANAAKTRFLAVASHDLRQPMHAVSLLVGLLSEKVSEPEVSNIVKKVQGSVDDMGELFNSLLDISKLDAGAIHPTIEVFAIAELLDRVKRTFEPLAEEKGLLLSVATSSSIVKTDAALLERIISNLVSNGIRYTHEGSVLLHCEAGDGILRISVADTGIGIADKYREEIYDEFFQISNPTQDRSKGLGLGLSIVKRCADLLGHELSMQSSPSGSQFSINLPCVGATDSVSRFTPGARPVSERLASAFVVIVDDDADSRFAAEATYRQWGCHVLAVESADQVIQALREHLRSPDLIVSDHQLASGHTGTEVIEAVRAYAESRMPAIIVTGDSGRLRPTELEGGFVVLQKPVGSERLKEVSEQLLACDTAAIH
jgi:signal transduction histidine kinase/CheY-like chemotaxis protein